MDVAVIDENCHVLPPSERGEIAVRVRPARPIGLFHKGARSRESSDGYFLYPFRPHKHDVIPFGQRILRMADCSQWARWTVMCLSSMCRVSFRSNACVAHGYEMWDIAFSPGGRLATASQVWSSFPGSLAIHPTRDRK